MTGSQEERDEPVARAALAALEVRSSMGVSKRLPSGVGLRDSDSRSVGSASLPARCAVLLVFAAAALAIPGPAFAQEADLPTAPAASETWDLSLDEALEVARSNSPAFLQVDDQTGVADWRVREAYSSLLPSASASGGLRYQGPGQQLIGSFTGDDLGAASTDYYFSTYSLNLSYSLSGSDLYGLASRRADRSATYARADVALYDLESRVTAQYLAALLATDATAVAERQLERADENLELASARADAGAVPGTDAVQAEVERGRAAVTLVRAENALRVEYARLLEQMGVSSARTLRLVSGFPVFDPAPVLDAAGSDPLETHPRLRSLREAETARRADVRASQSSYLPTLSLFASWSGFTRELGNTEFLLAQHASSLASTRQNCEFFNQISSGLSEPLDGYPRDCAQYVPTPASEGAALAANDVFPFDFEQQPLTVGMNLSIPLFQGLGRQRQVEEAQVQARSAEHDRRAGELQMQTEVTTARGNLRAAYDVVRIEERNRELAAGQLELAQERYALGAAPFLELLDAQSSAATAERDYLTATFDFHNALVELERVTGLELRPEGD